eukprot:571994_1
MEQNVNGNWIVTGDSEEVTFGHHCFSWSNTSCLRIYPSTTGHAYVARSTDISLYNTIVLQFTAYTVIKRHGIEAKCTLWFKYDDAATWTTNTHSNVPLTPPGSANIIEIMLFPSGNCCCTNCQCYFDDIKLKGSPTPIPTNAPTWLTEVPTESPSKVPTESPTDTPSTHPTWFTKIPSRWPSAGPSTVPTKSPSISPFSSIAVDGIISTQNNDYDVTSTGKHSNSINTWILWSGWVLVGIILFGLACKLVFIFKKRTVSKQVQQIVIDAEGGNEGHKLDDLDVYTIEGVENDKVYNDKDIVLDTAGNENDTG